MTLEKIRAESPFYWKETDANPNSWQNMDGSHEGLLSELAKEYFPEVDLSHPGPLATTYAQAFPHTEIQERVQTLCLKTLLHPIENDFSPAYPPESFSGGHIAVSSSAAQQPDPQDGIEQRFLNPKKQILKVLKKLPLVYSIQIMIYRNSPTNAVLATLIHENAHICLKQLMLLFNEKTKDKRENYPALRDPYYVCNLLKRFVNTRTFQYLEATDPITNNDRRLIRFRRKYGF